MCFQVNLQVEVAPLVAKIKTANVALKFVCVFVGLFQD